MRPCVQVNMVSHWEMLQRGIYRRDVQLELYYEVERLGKELSAAYDKLEQYEKEKVNAES